MAIPITNPPVPIDIPKLARDGRMGQETAANLAVVDKGSDHVFEFTLGGARYQVLTNFPSGTIGGAGFLAVYKSVDGGFTWLEQDAANEPALATQNLIAGDVCSFDVLLDADGTTLQCLYSTDNVNRNLRIISFDTLTDTWGAASIDGPAQPSTTFLLVSDFRIVQVASGDLWAFFNRSTLLFGEFVTSLQYSVFSGGVWAAEVLVRPVGTTLRRILRQVFVDTAADAVHVTWVDFAINGPAFCPLQHRSIDAGTGTLGAITQVDTKVGGGGTIDAEGALFTLGRSCLWDSKGLIVLTYARYGGAPNEKIQVYLGTPIAAPVWAAPVILDTLTDASTIDREPFAFVDTVADRLYVCWFSNKTDLSLDAMYFVFTDDGVTWSAPALLYDNVPNHALYEFLHTISYIFAAGDFRVATGIDTTLAVTPAGSRCIGAALIAESGGGGLTIDCDNPPVGIVGTLYVHDFPASSGTPPYTFALTAGALPPGLSLDASTGEVSGTPTVNGIFPFTIQVTDSDDNMALVSCSITIRKRCLLVEV